MSDARLINYKGVTLKQMEYTLMKIPKGELLGYDTLKDGYQYYIVSYGTHPCGYVALPKQHSLNGVHYDEVNNLCRNMDNVHGGFTFSRDELHDFIKNRWVLGWDYNHYGDKNALIDPTGYEYSVEELFDDIVFAVDLLRKLDKTSQH